MALDPRGAAMLIGKHRAKVGPIQKRRCSEDKRGSKDEDAHSKHKTTICNHPPWVQACANVIVSRMKSCNGSIDCQAEASHEQMDSKGRRKCSQANTILFTAKKLLRYTSVGIIIAWKGAHLSQRLNILPHPFPWCWWQCRCQCNACSRCIAARNALHWLPKWPSTCRRKCLGPRIGNIWSIENIRNPLICRIKTNQNKIQP